MSELIVFSADNGTAGQSRTIGGRQISGHKSTLLEGGAHVPLIANWKGVTPEGRVLPDLIDFTDMLATFADLADAKLPSGLTFDGQSFAPQLHGLPGTPRPWIYVQLGNAWYVRETGWKLTHAGELLNMQDAPFVEASVAADYQRAIAGLADKLGDRSLASGASCRSRMADRNDPQDQTRGRALLQLADWVGLMPLAYFSLRGRRRWPRQIEPHSRRASISRSVSQSSQAENRLRPEKRGT